MIVSHSLHGVIVVPVGVPGGGGPVLGPHVGAEGELSQYAAIQFSPAEGAYLLSVLGVGGGTPGPGPIALSVTLDNTAVLQGPVSGEFADADNQQYIVQRAVSLLSSISGQYSGNELVVQNLPLSNDNAQVILSPVGLYFDQLTSTLCSTSSASRTEVSGLFEAAPAVVGSSTGSLLSNSYGTCLVVQDQFATDEQFTELATSGEFNLELLWTIHDEMAAGQLSPSGDFELQLGPNERDTSISVVATFGAFQEFLTTGVLGDGRSGNGAAGYMTYPRGTFLLAETHAYLPQQVARLTTTSSSGALTLSFGGILQENGDRILQEDGEYVILK